MAILRSIKVSPLTCLPWALTIGLLLASNMAVEAHNGPPFAVIVDRRVGPCVISVWADPNIGPSRFYVIVNSLPGGTIPSDLTVQLGLQPRDGRLPEAVYTMERDNLRGQLQYKKEGLSFDRDEFWRVRISLHSGQGDGETATEVEATPIGLGRWDMLFYLSPFIIIGFAWFMATIRRRSRRKNAARRAVDEVGQPG